MPAAACALRPSRCLCCVVRLCGRAGFPAGRSAPDVTGYYADRLPKQTASANTAGGAAQHFVRDRDIPAEWWTLFRSRPLNTLVEKALVNNPDLQAAQAALRVARENAAAQGAHSSRRSMPVFRRRGSRLPARHQRRCARALDLQSLHRPGERVLRARRVRRQPARRRVARRAGGRRSASSSRRPI